jgi:RsiW-degrading membrane proteinase PrsW (M82 family)
VFSFWPSLSLLVFFLVIFLECRAIAGRVTLPLGSFLMVFCYGSIGAPLLALLLQQIPIFPDAGPASPATWLLGPPIEELAKALPVIVLAFLTRESRRLSIADLTLIGLASGAGFGFVEGNLNALVNGTLPSIQHLVALGLQTENGVVFFAGHAVTTALVGLAAGIGLRFLPPNILYAWVPSAFVIVWASFDHGVYNWKVLNASDGALPSAHFAVELLHAMTLKGQLATWLLPIGLIAAQLIEAYLCSKAVGVRRDLLLAREWRPWVANEWLVALMRVPLGRAVFAQTLAYFRLRRAFYLAAFETRRDPKDPTLSRHARSLEDRLKRERSILFDPAPGTWLLPTSVLTTYALQWAWRMRWVLVFAVLLLLLFMVDPGSLPVWLRQFLFGDVFAAIVVTLGLAFAVWQIFLFGRIPPPDPLAAEGTVFASHYTRQLLLACSLACGLFPALAVLLGWKALAPGAAFIGGYLPGWIAQGGNLQTLLGLGTIGGAVAPDPRPAGEAFRHEIAAGEERIRRLGSEIEGAPSLHLKSFLDTMGKLDAERDAQARRQLALDGCERQASEATIRDPAPVVQAIKDEFDRLTGELLEAAAKDLDAMSSLEQDYARLWSGIMHDLDAQDALRCGLRAPLRDAWQAQNDIGWALRVASATDDGLLPMQLTLLSELREIATSALAARSEIVAAGVERIRATAAEYGETDPFSFAGAATVEDESALLAEVTSSAPKSEEPRTFGLRAHPADALAQPSDKKDETQQSTAAPAPSRGQHYQEALDQLIEASKRDTRYLETIRRVERSDEALRQPIESSATQAPRPEDSPAAAPTAEHHGELEDLINAIKRDSGYLEFAKDAPVARAENRARAKAADTDKAPEAEAPAQKEPSTGTEPVVSLSTAQREEQERAAFADRPAPVIAARVETPAELQAEVDPVPQAIDNEWAIAAAAYKQAQELPATPSVEGSESAKAAAAQAPAEPAQAEATASHGEPVEHAEIEAPTAAVETIQPEIATLAEPEASAEPAQGEAAASHVESVEPAEIEAPLAALESTTPELAKPTNPEVPVESAQIEAPTAPAKPIEHAGIEAPAAAVETATPALANSTEPEAPVERAQIEAPTAPAKPVEQTEIRALAARFAPEAKKAEPSESISRMEGRASFFARLFEAAMRHSSDSTATSERRDAPHDGESKPVAAQSLTTPDTPDQTIGDAADKHDADPQKVSNEISAPTSEWLADFAAVSSNGAKTQSEDTLLEKIEWPTLGQPAHEPAPADSSVRATSTPAEVADPLEAPSDANAEPGSPPVQHETVPAQPVESAAASVVETVESSAAPIETAKATQAAEKPQGTDEFESKVDRLSYLLEKLERAMQTATATPAPQDATPSTQAQPADRHGAHTQASEPAIAVEPEQVAQLERLDERVAAPAEEPATVAEPIADASAHTQASEPAIAVEPEHAPSRPSAEASQQDERVATPAGEPATVAEPIAETRAQAQASEPAIAAEPELAASRRPAEDIPQPDRPEPADAPATPQESAEERQKSDRLSYLLAKLFETVKQDSAPKPVAPQQDHAEASDILDLRGPHPIPEPRDEPAPAPVEAPPQEESARVEARPEPAAPPAQVPTAVVDQPASTDATVLPTREDAKPADVSQAAPPADASESLPTTPEPTSEQPVKKTRSRSAPATHFGSRKTSRASTAAPANGEAKPVAKVEAEPEPIALPEQTHDAVVDEPVSTGDEVWAARGDANPADVAQPAPPAETSEPVPAAEHPSEQPIHPKTISRSAAPATHFGSRKAPHSSAPAPLQSGHDKPSASKRAREPVELEAPATTPKRDWKLTNGPLGAETPKSKDPETAKKSGPAFRMKTGSGALANVDTAPTVSPAATATTQVKYYGPRHVGRADGEAGSDTHAQLRAISLADALSDFYANAGTPQPAMYTTDRATLHRIIASGKLDPPRRRGAPWSISGVSRRGEVAIRLKPGSEQYIEFVPSTEIFGQVPHYYPRGVGKGSYQTHVLAEHLEYFDIAARQWAPLRG